MRITDGCPVVGGGEYPDARDAAQHRSRRVVDEFCQGMVANCQLLVENLESGDVTDQDLWGCGLLSWRNALCVRCTSDHFAGVGAKHPMAMPTSMGNHLVGGHRHQRIRIGGRRQQHAQRWRIEA